MYEEIADPEDEDFADPAPEHPTFTDQDVRMKAGQHERQRPTAEDDE